MSGEMLTITEMDYYRLHALVEQNPNLEELENEIEEARIIDFPEIPSDLVTMNSRFRYLIRDENKECEMTIVYPQHADLENRKISVTAPLGAALLGLREGEEIQWKFPDDRIKTLKVLEILYQPEANNDLHL